jgi:hypothetical protein
VSLVASEGAFFVVSRDNVLTYFRAEFFEQVTSVAKHWEVAEYRVFFLRQIVHGNPKHD